MVSIALTPEQRKLICTALELAEVQLRDCAGDDGLTDIYVQRADEAQKLRKWIAGAEDVVVQERT